MLSKLQVTVQKRCLPHALVPHQQYLKLEVVIVVALHPGSYINLLQISLILEPGTLFYEFISSLTWDNSQLLYPMKRSLGAYMNKSQSTYREIHSSRTSVALTQRKQSSKGFSRHPNGIIVGSNRQQKGLILLEEGFSILNIKGNGVNKQTLYCFNDMSYCYQVKNQSRSGTFAQLLFFKADCYLILYTLKNDRQDGFQYTYDYGDKKMTKSYYKNNHLRQIIQTCTLSPREAEEHPEFVDLFERFSGFNFAVEGCKRLEISENMTYFGEVRNDAPNGFGVILSLEEKYVGSFRDGLLEGHGTIFFPNGDICEGLFIEGESNRCSKYTKPYGTIYFLNGKVSGEQQYCSIIEEYKGRFTIDSHDKLVFPLSHTILELKQNLDIFQKKKVIKVSPQIKSELSDVSQSQAKLDDPGTKLRVSPNQKQIRRVPSRSSRMSFQNRSNKSGDEPMESRVNFNQQTPPPYFQRERSISGTSSPEEAKDNFFDSLKIQQVNQDTVAEEVKRNFPKSLDIQVMKERRTNEVNFIYQKSERLLGGYLMEMIKENSNEMENNDKGISMVTDRIKKSRIFSGKKSRIDRITFTF